MGILNDLWHILSIWGITMKLSIPPEPLLLKKRSVLVSLYHLIKNKNNNVKSI